MKKKTFKNFIIRLLMQAVMMVLTATVCYAAVNSREEFLTIQFDQNGDALVDFNIDKIDPSASFVKDEFIFLQEGVSVLTDGADVHTGIHTQIIKHAFDLSSEELLIGVCKKYCESEDSNTKLTFIVPSVIESGSLYFETVIGEHITIDNINGQVEKNEMSLTISFSEEELDRISYFNEKEKRSYILKVGCSENMCPLSAVSIEQEVKGLGIARAMKDITAFYGSAADCIQYSKKHGSNEVNLYKLSDDQITVFKEEDFANIELVGDNTSELKFKQINECSEEDKALIGKFILQKKDNMIESSSEGVSVVHNTEEVGISEEEFNEDIPEDSYIELDQEDSSTVYAESFLFTGEDTSVHYYKKAGYLGLEFYINAFGLRGYVCSDLPANLEDMIQIGDVFDTSFLPANSMLVEVLSNRENSFVGKMDLVLEGEEVTASKKVTYVASPSDAARPESKSDAIISESSVMNSDYAVPGTESDVENSIAVLESSQIEETGMEAETDLSESSKEVGEVSEENMVEGQPDTQVIIETAKEGTSAGSREVYFLKENGEKYSVRTGETYLTEAFLKKASYCAVDEYGTVIVIYNEHGRVLQIAEGYSEDDVYSYILLPYAENVQGEEADLCISELTVSYNDILCQDGTYALVSYINGDGNIAQSDMAVYTNIGMEEYVDLTLEADTSKKIFYLTADAMSAELQVDLLSDYTLSAELESRTTMEQDTDKGSEVIEKDSEIVYIPGEGNELKETGIASCDNAAVPVNHASEETASNKNTTDISVTNSEVSDSAVPKEDASNAQNSQMESEIFDEIDIGEKSGTIVESESDNKEKSEIGQNTETEQKSESDSNLDLDTGIDTDTGPVTDTGQDTVQDTGLGTDTEQEKETVSDSGFVPSPKNSDLESDCADESVINKNSDAINNTKYEESGEIQKEEFIEEAVEEASSQDMGDCIDQSCGNNLKEVPADSGCFVLMEDCSMKLAA